MHNVLDDIKEIDDIDLNKEYKNALTNSDFKTVVKSLKVDEEILKKYTSLLEESSVEYGHCKNCKGLLDCSNKVEGYCYLPVYKNDNLVFEFRPCKYKTILDKKNKTLDNVKYFNTPLYLKDASLDKIYKTDKNRFKVINYLMDFLDEYESSSKGKGLYLHGNFGCGKTYLISAIFNELAKSGHKSCIVFWPEFLRQAFYEDFNERFEYIKKVPLLLIDDIGAEGLNSWYRDEILCPLLQYRMDNNLTTFLTSNLNLKELENHLSNTKDGADEIKAKRIISRIEQLTDDLEMISKNLRN